MKTRLLNSATLTTALLMAACGGPPSSGDIKTAMERSISSNPATISMDVKILEVERLSCQSAGEKTYVCDVRASGTSILQPRPTTSTRTLRLAKASDGWVTVE